MVSTVLAISNGPTCGRMCRLMIRRVARPDRLGALDVHPFPQAHDLGADDPRGGGPLQDADHDDHVEQALPPEVRDYYGEHQVGDDQAGCRSPASGRVDPAAEIAGQDADPSARSRWPRMWPANPTTRGEMRPPCMSSLSMSMPPSSQPSQWRLDGGA